MSCGPNRPTDGIQAKYRSKLIENKKTMGETQLVASGHPGCSRSGAVYTGFGSCMVPDFETRTINTGAAPQMLRDYRGDLERTNLFVYINHELDNGNDFFSEISIYSAESERQDNNGSFPAGNIAIASVYDTYRCARQSV